MIFGPVPFMGGGPVAIERTDAMQASVTALTVYTFSGVNLPGGFIVVAVNWLHGSSNRTLDSVSIGGIAAVRAVRAIDAAAIGNAELWGAVVPTSNDGEIVLTFSGAMTAARCIPYRFTNVKVKTAHSTGGDTKTGTTPTSTTINVPAKGGALSTVYTNQAITYSWSGLTEDIDVSQAGGSTSTAFDVFDTLQSGLAVTATPSGSSSRWHATASWR